MHHENCQCLACMTWFVLMAQFTGRGRCQCGHPIDDHRMSTKGELQACPAPAHA
jgi:hypothetical protein